MKKILFVLLAFVLYSCSDDTEIATDTPLVIEGYIEDGKFPVVSITKGVPISLEEQNIDMLEKYMVRWARVSVVNGNDTVILTGKYDKGFFPPYIYTTSWMRGKTGETYKLIVEYDGKRAEATTTIPSPPEVDRYIVERCQDYNYKFQIKAVIPKGKETKYYQFFTTSSENERQFLASFLGSYCVESGEGNLELPVYRGHSIQNRDYSPYFSMFDKVSVKCCRLDEYEFDYWKSYIEMQVFSGAGIFHVYKKLPSNITGGIGYWFGYGSTVDYLDISKYYFSVHEDGQ